MQQSDRVQQSRDIVKTYPTLGCCGIDCGLCPRYYTAGTSRCPGCCGPDFFNKHPSCSLITCCVKQRDLEVCAQCNEFPCSKFEGWTEESEDVYDSFVTHRKAMPNLHWINEHGIHAFIDQQGKRIKLLERMLQDFDDGRSKSYYCIAAALLPLADLETSLNIVEHNIKNSNIGVGDSKSRAKILKESLDNIASKNGIDLKLRKKVNADERR